MTATIDKVFREYGERFFGKKAMDMITDAQVEEARCEAMKELSELTKLYGKQTQEALEELFCNYVFGTFM